MNEGLMIVISGPAGSGKGTVVEELVKTGDFVCSVSWTTRGPRPGEVDGKHYCFVTPDAFRARLAEDGMLEHTEYCENLYGSPRREAEAVVASGKNLILEIEVDGAMQVKRNHPDAILIMLLPPSFAVQEKRLRGRATEPDDKIAARLEKARKEVPMMPYYDYVVYNEENGQRKCAEDILAIIRAERCATVRHPDDPVRYFATDNDDR